MPKHRVQPIPWGRWCMSDLPHNIDDNVGRRPQPQAPLSAHRSAPAHALSLAEALRVCHLCRLTEALGPRRPQLRLTLHFPGAIATDAVVAVILSLANWSAVRLVFRRAGSQQHRLPELCALGRRYACDLQARARHATNIGGFLRCSDRYFSRGCALSQLSPKVDRLLLLEFAQIILTFMTFFRSNDSIQVEKA
ncbi:hypothetical protein MCBRY_003243 [Methylocystis bryophila]